MHTPYQPPASPRPRRARRSAATSQPPAPRAVCRQPRPQPTAAGRLREIGARLTVNGLLAVAATASLLRLIPYAQAQQQQLTAVQAAVAQSEVETAQLKSDFGRYFDPRQASNVMQEQSGWESPSQRQIVWVDPTAP
jgi:hypothetical protein